MFFRVDSISLVLQFDAIVSTSFPVLSIVDVYVVARKER